MGTINLDADLKARLNGMNEQMQVLDDKGSPLGYFVPAAEYNKLLLAGLKIPFSEEEIKRRRAEKGGCSLKEVWQHIEQKYGKTPQP